MTQNYILIGVQKKTFYYPYFNFSLLLFIIYLLLPTQTTWLKNYSVFRGNAAPNRWRCEYFTISDRQIRSFPILPLLHQPALPGNSRQTSPSKDAAFLYLTSFVFVFLPLVRGYD